MKKPPDTSPPAVAASSAPYTTILRPLVLAVATFYLLTALSEVLLGSEGLIVRNRQILLYGSTLNIAHWVTGLLLVGGYVAGRSPARVVAILAGAGLVALGVGGALARHRAGAWLGFEAALPFAYNVIHGGTGLPLLLAGLGLQPGARPATAAAR